MPIRQQTPEDAYESVLDSAGCIFPKRDDVDMRIVSDTRTGCCTYDGPGYTEARYTRLLDPTVATGIIDSPDDVDGWPVLESLPAPKDSDKDGMPDAWETAHGLNPNNAADRNNIGPGGYTWLEVYLNSLVTPEGSTSHIQKMTCSPFLESQRKYDLSGRVITSTNKGKVYIQNGKKHISK